MTSRERWLLVSDVDNTVLGDDAATRRFADFVDAHRDRLWVALNSGRFVDSILESVASTDLPEPDIVIGGVGTDIRPLNPTIRDHPDYGPALSDWASTHGHDDWGDRVRDLVHALPGVEPQPVEQQSSHKASFFARNAKPDFFGLLEKTLVNAGVEANIVYSSHRDLDVLPKGVDKAAATRHLAETLDLPANRVMVSGDSGNDRAMLMSGYRAIVVANALPELDDLQGPDIFRANKPYADGVVEGLEHWMS